MKNFSGGSVLLFIFHLLIYADGLPVYFYAITYLVWITSPLWYGLVEEKRDGWDANIFYE